MDCKKSPYGEMNFGRCVSLFLFFSVIFLALFLSKTVISHFFLAVVLAYILNPLATFIERRGIPRSIGSMAIVLLLFSVFAMILLYAFPILTRQFFSVLEAISKFIPIGDEFVIKFKEYYTTLSLDNISNIVEIITNGIGEGKTEKLFANISVVFHNAVHYGVSLTEIVISIAIFPLLTFYTLWDWPTFIIEAKNLVPRPIASEFTEVLESVEKSIVHCIRGQAIAAIIVFSYYSIALNIAGMKSAFILATFAGFMSFIPYIGAIIASTTSILTAAAQFRSLSEVLIIGAIFLCGQILEGQVVVPLLVGRKIEIHPVWVMVGVILSATLFGVLGALVSLPLTSAGSTIVKFIIKKYKHSDIYRNF